MEFSIPLQTLDAQTNKKYKKQLNAFFNTYHKQLKKEQGVLCFASSQLTGENKKIFGDDEPLIIKELTKIMSTMSTLTSAGNLKIFKMTRNQGLTFHGDKNVLARVFLIIGDDAFFHTMVPHSGVSTGRAPKITRLVEGGNGFIPKPSQDIRILDAEKATVFKKGEGKREVVKPKNFTQYIVSYDLSFGDDMLKNLRNEFMKTGNLDSILNKEKINDVLRGLGMSDLETEMKRFMKQEDKEEEAMIQEFENASGLRNFEPLDLPDIDGDDEFMA